MAFHHNPNIVVNNLELYLDAANIKSYPGTGTTWYDISGKGYHAELYNGITHTTPINGLSKGITLAGSTSDQFIYNTTFPAGFSSFSIEIVFYHNGTDQLGSYGVLSWGNNYGPLYYNHTTNMSSGHYLGNSRYLSSVGGDNLKWCHLIYTYNDIKSPGARNYKVYKNSVLVVDSSYDFLTNLYTGGSGNGSPGYVLGEYTAGANTTAYKGSYGILKFYSSVLSQNEVNTNFNSIKSRFGL